MLMENILCSYLLPRDINQSSHYDSLGCKRLSHIKRHIVTFQAERVGLHRRKPAAGFLPRKRVAQNATKKASARCVVNNERPLRAFSSAVHPGSRQTRRYMTWSLLNRVWWRTPDSGFTRLQSRSISGLGELGKQTVKLSAGTGDFRSSESNWALCEEF